ncbi:MAG: ATP-binding protein, partial [Methanosarcinales archaeon]
STDKPVLAFGRAFKRIGKSTIKMSRDEFERLILEKRKIYFDTLVCKGANLSDIDWDFVKNFFIPIYESLTETELVGISKDLLDAMDCIVDNKPTNAGILLFGKTPQKFFPSAYIALARYRGDEVGIERLDYKEFTGTLFQQIDNCDKYIKNHIAIMSRLHPYQVEREDIPEYPLFSIRELITNAVVHRDYSERGSKVIIKMFNNTIEFYNPGGLEKGITPKNIVNRQFSRNPVLAKVLSKVRYIEELGEGWDKIIKEHKEHPLNPKLPKIIADDFSMMVILCSIKEKFEKGIIIKYNARQKKAIEYLKKYGKITNSEYQKINRVNRTTAYRDLKELVKIGYVEKVGTTGRKTYYIMKRLKTINHNQSA